MNSPNGYGTMDYDPREGDTAEVTAAREKIGELEADKLVLQAQLNRLERRLTIARRQLQRANGYGDSGNR